jgi:hypothetical protein
MLLWQKYTDSLEEKDQVCPELFPCPGYTSVHVEWGCLCANSWDLVAPGLELGSRPPRLEALGASQTTWARFASSL